MTSYTFDAKAFIVVTIEADTEAEARRKLEAFDYELGDASITLDDGEQELIEVDGEPVP